MVLWYKEHLEMKSGKRFTPTMSETSNGTRSAKSNCRSGNLESSGTMMMRFLRPSSEAPRLSLRRQTRSSHLLTALRNTTTI